MTKILHYIIQFTWGLPQNILGFILSRKFVHMPKEKFFHSHIYYHNGKWGGISLGMFIIMNGSRENEWINTTKVHEYGHTLQSIILGPLYLFIIGIPSLVWCNARRYKTLRTEKDISYFDFYAERWANALGEKFTGLVAPKK